MVASVDAKRLFVVTGRGKGLLSLDVATGGVLASVEVGQRPWGVSISPDGGTLYTANGSSNDVTVVDAKTLKVLRKIPVGEAPWGSAVLALRGGK
jgi:YVTN family beta-propeller protein